jgi:Na+/proline symporter
MWVAVPATVFSVLLFAGRWRRARIDSPVEYLETRYSHTFRQICAWQGLPVIVIDDALKMIATGTIVSVGLGMEMNESILWSGVVILSYTFMGGLWAVIITDFVQFVVLAAAVVILVPLSLSRVGGFAGLVDRAPAGYFHPTNPEFNWAYVTILVALYCVAWSSTRWALIQKYYCVPREKDTLKMGALVTLLNAIGPPLMFLPALAACQFLPGIQETKEVYPRLCAELLPAGMLGLIIAAMFAATMSTLSGDFNVCAGVLTNDVYRRLVRPRASDWELVLVGRGMTLLVGAIAIGVGLLLAGSSAEDLFRYMVTLFGIAAAPLGIPMLLGLVSRRATNLSAIVGSVSGVAVGLLLFFTLPAGGEILGIKWDQELALFVATSLVTLVTMLGLSIVVPMKAGESQRAVAFHQRLQTPIGEAPEDQVAHAAGQAVISPFRVVGICTLLIGLLLLGILPWIELTIATWLNVLIGGGLVVVGGLVAWLSRTRTPAPDREAAEPASEP